ncbi:Predicted arabinose efflux permease, MFS family [Granulicella rosea]|uniref:Predicted arabinose efflux permease, MFS family n=1 Tax=Granulicella rosea TaxID=474952 RepID=A0A239EZK1_9BACT|nr:MFS transporter [Granulicella rosea]SNS49332.1 Predicted arabinose efflux permease, MFS family [Granulicella rosea]
MTQSAGNGIFSWLTQASSLERRTLLAAALGWMLDSMDVMLYTLVLGQVQRELHLSSALAGAMMSATLLSAAFGGIAFGWFADRFGRTRALTLSVLIYSVFTAACGFTHTAATLMICRILLGLGMGGEWASGAALVAETWPAEHRGKALALVQSSWAIGYMLGAAIVALILPRYGWRPVFFVGILPALLTLWFRRGLHESAAWTAERANATQPAASRYGELFRGSLGRNMLICTSMNAATLFAYWGLFTWVPRFLSMSAAEGGRGMSIVKTSGWTIAMQAGTFLGYVTFGYLADRFSRKYTYIGYLAMAAVMVPLFVFVPNPSVLLLLGPLVGFFGTGYFSGFAIITSELFPTALRGSAMGFAYNTGRILSAAAPYIIGRISQSQGLSSALTITSGAFLLAALIASTLRLSAKS